MMGSRYLGGWIGDPNDKDVWLDELKEKWMAWIDVLVLAAKIYPQSAYTGLNKLLQPLRREVEPSLPSSVWLHQSPKAIAAICMQGSRVPTSRISTLRPQWEDRAGLSLFQNTKTATSSEAPPSPKWMHTQTKYAINNSKQTTCTLHCNDGYQR
jgi:hypothetical protein